MFTCFEFFCYKSNLDLTCKKYITRMFGVRVAWEGISGDGVDINPKLFFIICSTREKKNWWIFLFVFSLSHFFNYKSLHLFVEHPPCRQSYKFGKLYLYRLVGLEGSDESEIMEVRSLMFMLVGVAGCLRWHFLYLKFWVKG